MPELSAQGRAADLTETLHSSFYTSSDVYSREVERIFEKAWIPVAPSVFVAEPYQVITESIGHKSFFIRRSPDGSLEGFFNVCPHRAGPIVSPSTTPGTSRTLVCQYHGWSFNDDGSLRHARDFGATPPSSFCLKPVRVAEFASYVFVCLDEDAAPLSEYLGEYPSALERIPLDSYRYHSRSTRRVACNWKTYAENFLEGYHLPTVHPRLTKDSNAASYTVVMTEDPKWNVHLMTERPGSSFSSFGFLYPSYAFNVVHRGFVSERWMPRGPDSIDLYFEYFFDPSLSEDEAAHLMEFSELVADEDVRIAELVQQNLASGVYASGVLSPKWEEPLAVFQDLVRRTLA
jgi:choline monooxygenase